MYPIPTFFFALSEAVADPERTLNFLPSRRSSFLSFALESCCIFSNARSFSSPLPPTVWTLRRRRRHPESLNSRSMLLGPFFFFSLFFSISVSPLLNVLLFLDSPLVLPCKSLSRRCQGGLSRTLDVATNSILSPDPYSSFMSLPFLPFFLV